jgi:predicted CopG family antitoxin
MKTISLSETAYQRLLAWKEGTTFSEVIERMIPPKGTLTAALEASQVLPSLSESGFGELEQSILATRKTLPPSWSSSPTQPS